MDVIAKSVSRHLVEEYKTDHATGRGCSTIMDSFKLLQHFGSMCTMAHPVTCKSRMENAHIMTIQSQLLKEVTSFPCRMCPRDMLNT